MGSQPSASRSFDEAKAGFAGALVGNSFNQPLHLTSCLSVHFSSRAQAMMNAALAQPIPKGCFRAPLVIWLTSVWAMCPAIRDELY